MPWFRWFQGFLVLLSGLSVVQPLLKQSSPSQVWVKMLIDSVKASNNSMVVGLVFIFTCISIFSLLLGDIWMTIIDPRIKLTEKGGK